MAYFQLSEPTELYVYPFDYHSHIGGVLPVRQKGAPSLVGWLGKGDEDDGELLLFEHAIKFMQSAGNPLSLLASRTGTTTYERGECAAENIYIACIALAQKLSLGAVTESLPPTDMRLYQRVLEGVRHEAKQQPLARWLLPWLRYFNSKIFSSNKYTPFDDAYKTRSVLTDQVRAEPGKGEANFKAWIDASLDYLYVEGIHCTQIPAGFGDIPLLDASIQAFNKTKHVCYRALVHSPNAYVGGKKFQDDLEKMLPVLTDAALPATIGLDLLGVENRVADYQKLFEFLAERQRRIRKHYGPDNDKQSARCIIHIHCGEGAGASHDNRSLIGYYVTSRRRWPGQDFWHAMSSYIRDCVETAVERLAEVEGDPSGPHGAHGRKGKVHGLSGLFDELFKYNSLTVDGCKLLRFDITSGRTRALVDYNGKRSVMAFSEALDAPSSGNGSPSWYKVLSELDDVYAFRLGHAYYYRSFIAAKYPLLVFDTNLGSNAITGAAGFFESAEAYRINRGFRHMDGYIDTSVMPAVTDAIAYMSSDSLTESQIAFFLETSQVQKPLREVLENEAVAARISQYVKSALAPISDDGETLGAFFGAYKELVLATVGTVDLSSYRYQAMTRVLALMRNWRSYLLGADGQGVEHTRIQNEFLRMVILLAYNLQPAGKEVIEQIMLDNLQSLLIVIASNYWQYTVGPYDGMIDSNKKGLTKFEGFKAPASVITLRREIIGI